MSECLVSAKDYRQHFQHKLMVPREDYIDPRWDGIERRIGVKDRRAAGHERRWEGSRGRRFRMQDRRTS